MGRKHRRRGEYVGAAEPTGMLQFLIAQMNGARARLGQKAQHQGRGEGPGLGGVVVNLLHLDAGFLGHFARDGVFQRLARLDESGNGRIATRWPGGLPAEERLIAVAYSTMMAGSRRGNCSCLQEGLVHWRT